VRKNETVERIRALMQFETERTGPPPGFPRFPDLPGKRYTDPSFYELEKQQLWKRTWLLAGHLDEIPDPGCYKLWDATGQPVVIVHTNTGDVRAYYNTCRHRGAPLVRNPVGKTERFICGYHGWTYNHDGHLVGLRDRRDFVDLDFSCRSLYPVRLECVGKFLFANFDSNARSLHDELSPLVDQWQQFQFDSLRFVRKDTFTLACNWKIAMESNMEVYHVRSIHPRTVSPMLDHRGNVNTLYPGGHSRMVAPLHVSSHVESEELGQYVDDRPDIATVGEIPRTCVVSFNVLPNLVSPMNEKGLPVFLFWPTGIDTTRLELWWFGKDWGDGPTPKGWDTYIDFFNEIVEEDMQFGNGIQKGVESYAFGGVPLSYQESRIYHWHQAVDKLMGVDNIPESLRVAPVINEQWITR